MASSELPVLKGAILRSTVSLQSDNRLVEMVRAGAEPAFNTIVERYRTPLLRYASRMVDPDRAEDVVQEALVKAHGSLLQDDREIQLKPWLYRITHNLALDAIRQKSWNYDQLDDNYDGVRQPPDYLEQKERLRSIIEGMDTLPERQRRALILQAFEGRSSEEIARELDDGVPEVRQLVHRARVRMRNAFGALIPMPILLWLQRSSASAATTGASSGGKVLLTSALRTGVAKFATTAAVAVVIGAGAGVVVGETAIQGGHVSAQPVADVSPSGDANSSASAKSVRHAGHGTSAGRHDRSGQAGATDQPGTSGSPDSPSAGGGSSGSGQDPDKSADSTRGPSSGNDSSPSSGTPSSQSPSGGGSGSGGGSTGSGSTGSGSTGSGSTGSGSGSSGGGSTGGGSTGGGSNQTCVGPIATLPPICLPNLNGGSGSGSGSGSGLPHLP